MSEHRNIHVRASHYLVAATLGAFIGGVCIDLDHIPFILGLVGESQGRFLHLLLCFISCACLGGLSCWLVLNKEKGTKQ